MSVLNLRFIKRISKVLVFILPFTFLIFSAAKREKKFVKVFFPDGFQITAELAVTSEERQLGLMFRETIHPDQGMLFIFEDEDFHSIWMKNMKIPIDILWLNREKRIVHIEQLVPPCRRDPCPSYSSEIPAKFVLEIKAGSVEDHKLKVYDRLEFIIPSEFRR